MNTFFSDIGRTLRAQGGTIWLGVQRVGEVLWNALLIPSPFAPVMLFYHSAPLLIVYLHTTSPGNAVALDYLASIVGMQWYAMPLIFVLTAIIGYENRSARVNILLTLPMIGFGLLVLIGLLSGRLPAQAILFPLLYMVVGGWGCLALIRYYAELQNVKKVQAALMQQCTTVEKNYGELKLAHDKLKQQISGGDQRANSPAA